MSVSGTQGYAEEAPSLLERYESFPFEQVHAAILHLLPGTPGKILDIGSGTGRDAAALAERGHDVLAVEPTAALRQGAKTLHPSPRIEWVDDHLPDLASLAGREAEFDAVLATAVWMHLDKGQRGRAMPTVAALIRPGGVFVLTLRHGPVPEGRRMFEVTGDETVILAEREGLELVLRQGLSDGVWKRPGVHWTRLAFRRPTQADG